MSAPRYVCNAEITSVSLGFERDFILTAYLYLAFGDGFEQGFGGYALGGSPFDTTAAVARHHQQTNLLADFVGGCLRIAGVDHWDKMPGRVIRVAKERDQFGLIMAIGHATKDLWYEPEQRFAALVAAAGAA